MPILVCFVDDATLAILERIASETGREVDELAEAAIAEAALDSERSRGGPPRTEEFKFNG